LPARYVDATTWPAPRLFLGSVLQPPGPRFQQRRQEMPKNGRARPIILRPLQARRTPGWMGRAATGFHGCLRRRGLCSSAGPRLAFFFAARSPWALAHGLRFHPGHRQSVSSFFARRDRLAQVGAAQPAADSARARLRRASSTVYMVDIPSRRWRFAAFQGSFAGDRCVCAGERPAALALGAAAAFYGGRGGFLVALALLSLTVDFLAVAVLAVISWQVA